MKPGDIATLKVPYKGYRRIELLERLQYTWLVRICESRKEIEMYVNLMSRTMKISVRKDIVNYLKSQPLLDYKIN